MSARTRTFGRGISSRHAQASVNASGLPGVGEPMAKPPYELTAHAAVVVAEREIELAWVDRAFLDPERTEADRNDPLLRHALRRIAERNDRVLR
jgi:hypothetical protein